MRISLETLAVIASLITFIGGVVTWYSGAVQKRYAAQRDFSHLLKNYDQLASNQAQILSEIDERFDALSRQVETYNHATLLELKEVKGLQASLVMNPNRGENSTGWTRQQG